jgi:hypothetical protein
MEARALVEYRVVGLKKENDRVLFDENMWTEAHEAFTAAPLIVKNRAAIAAGGGDFGARGGRAAFDLNSVDPVTAQVMSRHGSQKPKLRRRSRNGRPPCDYGISGWNH